MSISHQTHVVAINLWRGHYYSSHTGIWQHSYQGTRDQLDDHDSNCLCNCTSAKSYLISGYRLQSQEKKFGIPI